MKKETQGGTYGRGGREDRGGRRSTVKEAEKVVEIVEIDDDEMGNSLKENFEEYVNKMKLAPEEDEEETEDTKAPVDKKADLSLYDELKTKNGK